MSRESKTPRSAYLVGPRYDWAFFLLAPSAALVAGMFVSGSAFSDSVFRFGGMETTAAELSLGAVIHAHLVAVVFRSHLNATIFPRYPVRFIVVPLVLWVAIVSSTWIAITATVVATFWDVWHSGAQTFGLARIYDRNQGNPPELGRRLDLWLNQLLYAGPILAGVTMIDHVGALSSYEDLGATFFSAIPAQASSHQRVLTWLVLAAGTAFLGYYVAAQVQFCRRGYRISPHKVFLVVSTGLCSIYTWGFNSWGEAFFIMNLFHAVQYLALVWAMEKKTVQKRLRIAPGRRGTALAALVFFGSVFAYGAGAAMLSPDLTTLWAITIVVSLMHFWYDAFVWSVRRAEV